MKPERTVGTRTVTPSSSMSLMLYCFPSRGRTRQRRPGGLLGRPGLTQRLQGDWRKGRDRHCQPPRTRLFIVSLLLRALAVYSAASAHKPKGDMIPQGRAALGEGTAFGSEQYSPHCGARSSDPSWDFCKTPGWRLAGVASSVFPCLYFSGERGTEPL